LGCRRTPRVEKPGIEEFENYWHLNTKTSVEKKQVPKIKSMQHVFVALQ